MQHCCIKFGGMGIIRQTKAVRTLLKIFTESEHAVSVPDLAHRLKAEMNKTTVYRILDRLEADGVIHSFMDKDGLKWYAKCTGCAKSHHVDNHPHFQCQQCGKIECLPVEIPLPELPTHHIESASILFVGTCQDCFG